MTPQERQMLSELFDRLASLENAPRDAEAASAIGEALKRAPNAVYPLVQTVLVQDEALKRAAARIREFEVELGIEPEQPAQAGGFLDSMRNALGGREQQGSVPSVRPGSAEHRASVWGPAAAPGAQPGGYAAAQEPMSAGGSFLGNAAASVAGVVGGSLLMHGMRSLFGGHGQGQGQGHGSFNPGGQSGSPWAPSTGSGGGDLSRQAGADDIAGGALRGGADNTKRAGLFDTAKNDLAADDAADDEAADLEDDNDFSDDDTDNA